MYINGHKRDDVVAYQATFVNQWAKYEWHFHIWNNMDAGTTLACPSSHPLPLILITYDKSTFYQNDQRKTCWGHQYSQPTLQPKGKGQSLMVLEFLTSEWGHLCNGNKCVDFPFLSLYLIWLLHCREAHIIFKPGKNRDGYFSLKELIAQVKCAIDIFEAKTNGLAQGLFIFDNAPEHMKCASDAITAKGMAKGVSQFYLFLCILTLCLPSSQVWLDAYTEQATHPR